MSKFHEIEGVEMSCLDCFWSVLINFKSAEFSKFDHISETHIVHMGEVNNWPLQKRRKFVVLEDFYKIFKNTFAPLRIENKW